MNFEDIKNSYVHAREDERKKIVKYLEGNGYTIVKGSRAGKGDSHYTSGNKIAPYDLSNWKYIEAEKFEKQFFISLQAFERDPNTNNIHVLMDRLGIYTYTGTRKNYNSYDAFTKMIITDIDLPLSDEKLNHLVNDYLK